MNTNNTNSTSSKRPDATPIKKRKKYGETSFLPLLRHVTGMKNITIELKTGRSYTGEIIDIDHFMNVTLKSTGNKQHQTQINQEINDDGEVIIRGPTIRYVIFPGNVNLNNMIRDGVDRERSAQNKYQRGIRKRK